MPLEKLSELFRGKKDSVAEEINDAVEPEVTDEMPVVPHKVLYADIPFFADSECQTEVQGARISILQPLDEDGFIELEVCPSRKIYQVGQYLTWLLNKNHQWEDCYYRNPETGQVERAWTLHIEFVGQVISGATVDKDRERIEKLEAVASAKNSTVM